MTEEFDLHEWLSQRSESVVQTDTEIVFEHRDGTRSILLPRKVGTPSNVQAEDEFLNRFYAAYRGASIADSMFMIAADELGGVRLSEDYVLPDHRMMKETVAGLGVNVPESQMVFMVEAAWMFIYACERSNVAADWVRYDRDYKKEKRITSLRAVLENWWQLVLDEADE